MSRVDWSASGRGGSSSSSSKLRVDWSSSGGSSSSNGVVVSDREALFRFDASERLLRLGISVGSRCSDSSSLSSSSARAASAANRLPLAHLGAVTLLHLGVIFSCSALSALLLSAKAKSAAAIDWWCSCCSCRGCSASSYPGLSAPSSSFSVRS
jgi:hypothetical protein